MARRKLPQLYTSRWANKDLADLDVVPVGISRGLPRWPLPYRYRLLRLLAPRRETFALQDLNEFEQAYLAGLEELGVEKIARALRKIGYEHGGRSLALLCYENTHAGEVCHRRIFATWIEEQTGQPVPELGAGMVLSRKDAATQGTLFETERGQA
jgi:hypothetical protein